jgi:hypothetical protein
MVLFPPLQEVRRVSVAKSLFVAILVDGYIRSADRATVSTGDAIVTELVFSLVDVASSLRCVPLHYLTRLYQHPPHSNCIHPGDAL